MKNPILMVLCLSVLAVLPACEKNSDGPDDSAPALSDSEKIALDVMAASAWEPEGSVADIKYTPKPVTSFKRQVLSGDVVHYSFQVKTGTGPYDVIGVHRVVKESKIGQPIKSAKNLFL